MKKKKKRNHLLIKTNKLGGGKKKKKREPLSHENFSHAIKGHSQNIINFAVSPNGGTDSNIITRSIPGRVTELGRCR